MGGFEGLFGRAPDVVVVGGVAINVDGVVGVVFIAVVDTRVDVEVDIDIAGLDGTGTGTGDRLAVEGLLSDEAGCIKGC